MYFEYYSKSSFFGDVVRRESQGIERYHMILRNTFENVWNKSSIIKFFFQILIPSKSGFSDFIASETDTEELSPGLLRVASDLSSQCCKLSSLHYFCSIFF